VIPAPITVGSILIALELEADASKIAIDPRITAGSIPFVLAPAAPGTSDRAPSRTSGPKIAAAELEAEGAKASDPRITVAAIEEHSALEAAGVTETLPPASTVGSTLLAME
jgi:hypothetical protein